jgi:hypothetical protein
MHQSPFPHREVRALGFFPSLSLLRSPSAISCCQPQGRASAWSLFAGFSTSDFASALFEPFHLHQRSLFSEVVCCQDLPMISVPPTFLSTSPAHIDAWSSAGHTLLASLSYFIFLHTTVWLFSVCHFCAISGMTSCLWFLPIFCHLLLKKIGLLWYNLHIRKLTHFKCIIQWF